MVKLFISSVQREFEKELREVADTEVYLGLFGVEYGYEDVELREDIEL